MIEKPICSTEAEIRTKLLSDIKQIPCFVEAAYYKEHLSVEKIADEIINVAFEVAHNHDLDDGRETLVFVQAYINGYINCVIEQEIIRKSVKEQLMMDNIGKQDSGGREC